MARRRITEEPKSRLAVWARRVALFALATAILGTIIVRADLLEIVPALATVAGALVLAGGAIVLALGAMVVIWKDGLEGFGSALGAMVIGLGLLAYPGYLGSKAYRLPAINDITTDPGDPPRLEALARVRPRQGSNPVTYPGADAAAKQNAAYPEIEPLLLSASPLVVYETTYVVINKRRWRIIEARQPLPRRRDGHIEAVARTPIMGFRDDVVVRIRAEQDGARIDVRSASRYGWHDLGTNAARITSLLEEIEAAIDALPPASRSPEPPAQEAPRPPRTRR
ncbi:MAG: DUF1499 domain-containing protein [Rhizobiales bacterium]|nr:DUF1499 domain-containing protein [Hyphomicrobiales bacterium]